MSQDKKRLDKIEESLTPKQSVILWMQEAHQYPNMFEYVSYLLSQPETAAPLWRLPDQVRKATRVAMKGHPEEIVQADVRRAVRDVYFLVHLHLRVNQEVMLEKRAWNLKKAVLAERLIRIMNQHSSARHERYMANYMAERVNREMPYPLDTETADAVQAAIRHNVTTWEELEEDGQIEDWLNDHLVSQGATELPQGSYEFRDGKFCPRVESDNEKEVRACFRDEVQFELFRSVEDYSNGLADITNAEYNAHYDEMVSTLHGLVDSGQVKASATVYLETVPISSLQEAPLVKGKWLDRYVIEMAEWGALLQTKGYTVQLDEKDHPLALAQFVRSDGAEADQGEVAKLLQKVVLNLAKFPGHTKNIDGRLYIHFEDYCNWRGRKVKGDLLPDIHRGLVAASWNAWVNAQCREGKATLTGVSVTLLQCYIEWYPYYICPNGTEDQLCCRKQLLDSLRTSHSRDNQQEELIQDWKDTIEGFLIELYCFHDTFASISQHYFDGHQMLFPDLVKELSDVIDSTEKLVDIFNDIFSNETDQQERMDIENIRRITSMRINQQTAYLVDMAKAKALENIGEKQAAIKLTERYL